MYLHQAISFNRRFYHNLSKIKIEIFVDNLGFIKLSPKNTQVPTFKNTQVPTLKLEHLNSISPKIMKGKNKIEKHKKETYYTS